MNPTTQIEGDENLNVQQKGRNISRAPAKALPVHVDISGLRGFATHQRLELAVPNGKVGSGLTIVVGQNNSGKSKITEAFAALPGQPSIIRHFSEGKRNKAAGDRISITLTFSSGYQRSAKTVASGGSQAQLTISGANRAQPHIMVLPSLERLRRAVRVDWLGKFHAGLELTDFLPFFVLPFAC